MTISEKSCFFSCKIFNFPILIISIIFLNWGCFSDKKPSYDGQKSPGFSLYNKHCKDCHLPLSTTTIKYSSPEEITWSIMHVESMNQISPVKWLKQDEINHIALSLGWTEGIKKEIDDGRLLYGMYCEKCHLPLENSTMSGKSASIIFEAMTLDHHMEEIPMLSNREINSLAKALGGEENLPINEVISLGEKLYIDYCEACHGDIRYTDKRNRSTQAIADSIVNVFEMANFSVLLQLTEDEIQQISDALSTSIINDSSNLIVERQILIGTKNKIASKFEYLFNSPNSDAQISTTISEIIENNNSVFGGNCTKFSGTGNCDIENDPFLAHLSSTPQTSAIRSGYTIQACNSILAQDAAIENLLSHSNLLITSNLDSTNFSKVFGLFFMGKSPTQSMIDQMNDYTSKAQSLSYSTLEQWRFLAVVLCETSAGQ